MSREQDSTVARTAATVEPMPMPMDGEAAPGYKVALGYLAGDYDAGRSAWRCVSGHFARYVVEVMPPVYGPEGSGSYALGECYKVTGEGAVHCVIAREGGRCYAKMVNLMRWADELLALRDALEASGPGICDFRCDRGKCRRPVCTGAMVLKEGGQ